MKSGLNGFCQSEGRIASLSLIPSSQTGGGQRASLRKVVIARHALVVVRRVHGAANGTGFLLDGRCILGRGFFSRSLFSAGFFVAAAVGFIPSLGGVFQFGLEIARADAPPSGVPEKMAILTARAEEFKFALEIKQSSKLCVRFRQAGEGVGTPDWGVGPVLYGSVAEWICQERKGLRKYENFKLLRAAAAPGTRWVFCGDNGASEKDLEAAQMMISAFPGALRAVFLHAVSPTTQPAPLPEDTTFDGVPIRFFRTYATAARKAAELGLVDAAGAQRVYAAVQADMALDADNIGRGSANERLLLAELDAAAA